MPYTDHYEKYLNEIPAPKTPLKELYASKRTRISEKPCLDSFDAG